MPKTLLITGSQGMLATDISKTWSTAGYKVIGLSHKQLDIIDPEAVRIAVDQFKPDIVINTPGISVDACEAEPEVGYKIHAWAAQNIATQCQRVGAECVYISTCGLFGDNTKFYSEYDPVELKTKYATSKYYGEQLSALKCQKLFVIRPGWLYGGEISHSRNFVQQRYLEARNSTSMVSATDKFGSPTYTVDLAEKLLEIVQAEQHGLYHITNSGEASRYEYVKFIIDCFGMDTVVEPVDSSFFQRTAPVPDCEMLDNLNIKFLGLNPMPSWQDAIERYVWVLKHNGPSVS